MSRLERLTIGIDIGGTKIASGLVDAQGEIISAIRTPMITTGDEMLAFDCVTRAIEGVLFSSGRTDLLSHGIGICAPGPLDPKTGTVINPPHVPCWRNFPLAERIEGVFGVPVRVDNDANAAGLAEALWGAGKNAKNVFYATLGTGVGTGIIFDGQIYYGRTGAAGEGGHTTIDYKGPKCSCGKRGCIDVLCSGKAIAERARERIRLSGNGSRILEIAGCPEKILAEHVGQACREGDTFAHSILSETSDLVVIWLGNVIDLLEPDVIVLGGGVAELLVPFLGHIADELPKWTLNPRGSEIPVVPARYGAEAGIAGAAALILAKEIVTV